MRKFKCQEMGVTVGMRSAKKIYTKKIKNPSTSFWFSFNSLFLFAIARSVLSDSWPPWSIAFQEHASVSRLVKEAYTDDQNRDEVQVERTAKRREREGGREGERERDHFKVVLRAFFIKNVPVFRLVCYNC